MSPDFYDSVKIANDQIKQRKKSSAFVEMKKQTKRDFSKLWQGSELYKNIQRENQRTEYIKKLLTYTSEDEEEMDNATKSGYD